MSGHLEKILNTVRRFVSFYKDRASQSKLWNVLLDEKVRPIETLPKEYSGICTVSALDRSSDNFWQWLRQAGSRFLKFRYPHKKALEFFYSAAILDIQKDDIVLDAAGGRSEYLSDIQRTTSCHRLYVNDHIYSTSKRLPSGITIVGGDVTTIDLPDDSVTKIACHHALEHFQLDKDIKFILEISRLLKPGGRACIIPLFLSDCYAEVWNIDPEKHYDKRALCLADHTSSIPGSDDDGHFARIYDHKAFSERLLFVSASVMLNSRIVECTLDGQVIPDMSTNFGSKINRPLRALVLEKSKDG